MTERFREIAATGAQRLRQIHHFGGELVRREDPAEVPREMACGTRA